MAIRPKNHDLLSRNGIWHLNKRLPESTKHHRVSLRTGDIEEARRKRDDLLAKWDEFAKRVREHSDILALRREYLGLLRDDEREVFEALIEEKAEELADRLGAWKDMKSLRPVDEASSGTQEVVKFWQTATGRLTPIQDLTPNWLASIENKKTRVDYRRGIEVLSKHFAATEEITWEKARAFLREVQQSEEVSGATLRKWLTAYTNFWDFYDRDTAVWKNHKLSSKRVRKPRPWSRGEVVSLYQTLVSEDDWLRHPVWIAAHTGARLGAICGLSYDSQAQTVTFPAQKREESVRTIPAHPAIAENLSYWVQNAKSASTVGSRFTKFKTRLGFGTEVDFHSFRRTFCTEMENLGCPEGITADIVGHKKTTMSYGVYSGGFKIDQMAEWLIKLSYPSENP